jgi:hypothetical protein
MGSDNFISFPDLHKIVPRGMNQLYIRTAYVDLFNIILECLADKKASRIHNFIITGTPGVGKSVFLFYVLWRLSQMEETEAVILRRHLDRGRIFVFTKHGGFMTTKDVDIDPLLDKESTWYLTDTLDPPPGIAVATTLLVCSPARKHYSQFLKLGGTIKLYMPLWSWSEFLRAAPTYNVNAKDLASRYKYFGGVARYVLEREVNPVKFLRESLNRIDSFSLKTLLLDPGEEEYEKLVHSIIHYEVDPDYSGFQVRLASSYVTERLLEKFVKYRRQELVQFIIDSASNPLLQSVRGAMFEAFAHRCLSVDNTWKVRSLETNVDHDLHLKVLGVERFNDIDDCKNVGVYYTPMNPKYPCIDSYMCGVGHFQMTVSNRHPIHFEKMKKIIQTTSNNKLYFVVPLNIVNDFKLQTFRGEKGKSGEVFLEQFVIGIDLDGVFPPSPNFPPDPDEDEMMLN